MNKKNISKVRKCLYMLMSIFDSEPVVAKFIIASKCNDTATVSHLIFFYLLRLSVDIDLDFFVNVLRKGKSQNLQIAKCLDAKTSSV